MWINKEVNSGVWSFSGVDSLETSSEFFGNNGPLIAAVVSPGRRNSRLFYVPLNTPAFLPDLLKNMDLEVDAVTGAAGLKTK